MNNFFSKVSGTQVSFGLGGAIAGAYTQDPFDNPWAGIAGAAIGAYTAGSMAEDAMGLYESLMPSKTTTGAFRGRVIDMSRAEDEPLKKAKIRINRHLDKSTRTYNEYLGIQNDISIVQNLREGERNPIGRSIDSLMRRSEVLNRKLEVVNHNLNTIIGDKFSAPVYTGGNYDPMHSDTVGILKELRKHIEINNEASSLNSISDILSSNSLMNKIETTRVEEEVRKKIVFGNKDSLKNIRKKLFNQYRDIGLGKEEARKRATGLAPVIKQAIPQLREKSVVIENQRLTFKDGGSGKDVSFNLTGRTKEGVPYARQGNVNFIAKNINPFGEAYEGRYTVPVNGKNGLENRVVNAFASEKAFGVTTAYSSEEMIELLHNMRGGESSVEDLRKLSGQLEGIKIFSSLDSKDTKIEVFNNKDLTAYSRKVGASIELGLGIKEKDGVISLGQISRNIAEGEESSPMNKILSKLAIDTEMNPLSNQGLSSLSVVTSPDSENSIFTPGLFHAENRGESSVNIRDHIPVHPSNSKFLKLASGKSGEMGESIRVARESSTQATRVHISNRLGELIPGMFGPQYTFDDGYGLANPKHKYMYEQKQQASVFIPNIRTAESPSYLLSETISSDLLDPNIDNTNKLIGDSATTIKAGEALGYTKDGKAIKLGSQFTSGKITNVELDKAGARLLIDAKFIPKELTKMYGTSSKTNVAFMEKYSSVAELALLESKGYINTDNGVISMAKDAFGFKKGYIPNLYQEKVQRYKGNIIEESGLNELQVGMLGSEEGQLIRAQAKNSTLIQRWEDFGQESIEKILYGSKEEARNAEAEFLGSIKGDKIDPILKNLEGLGYSDADRLKRANVVRTVSLISNQKYSQDMFTTVMENLTSNLEVTTPKVENFEGVSSSINKVNSIKSSQDVAIEMNNRIESKAMAAQWYDTDANKGNYYRNFASEMKTPYDTEFSYDDLKKFYDGKNKADLISKIVRNGKSLDAQISSGKMKRVNNKPNGKSNFEIISDVGNSLRAGKKTTEAGILKGIMRDSRRSPAFNDLVRGMSKSLPKTVDSEAKELIEQTLFGSEWSFSKAFKAFSMAHSDSGVNVELNKIKALGDSKADRIEKAKLVRKISETSYDRFVNNEKDTEVFSGFSRKMEPYKGKPLSYFIKEEINRVSNVKTHYVHKDKIAQTLNEEEKIRMSNAAINNKQIVKDLDLVFRLKEESGIGITDNEMERLYSIVGSVFNKNQGTSHTQFTSDLGGSIHGMGNSGSMSHLEYMNLKSAGLPEEVISDFTGLNRASLQELSMIEGTMRTGNIGYDSFSEMTDRGLAINTIFKAEAKDRRAILENSGIKMNKNDTTAFYRLENEVDGVRSIPISLEDTNYSGAKEFEDKKIIFATEKARKEVILTDMALKEAVTEDSKVLLQKKLGESISTLLSSHKAMMSGDNNLYKNAAKRIARGSMNLTARPYGAVGDGNKSIKFVSMGTAKRMYEAHGLDYEKFMGDSGELLDRHGNSLYSLGVREPAQGPFSSMGYQIKVDSRLSDDGDHIYIPKDNSHQKIFAFLDFDNDHIREMSTLGLNKDSAEKFIAYSARMEEQADSLIEMQSKIGIKGTTKEIYTTADFADKTDMARHNLKQAQIARLRKTESPNVTRIVSEMNKALDIEGGGVDLKIPERVLTHNLTENLLKSQHKSADASLRGVVQDIESLQKSFLSGSVGNDEYSTKLRDLMDRTLGGRKEEMTEEARAIYNSALDGVASASSKRYKEIDKSMETVLGPNKYKDMDSAAIQKAIIEHGGLQSGDGPIPSKLADVTKESIKHGASKGWEKIRSESESFISKNKGKMMLAGLGLAGLSIASRDTPSQLPSTSPIGNEPQPLPPLPDSKGYTRKYNPGNPITATASLYSDPGLINDQSMDRALFGDNISGISVNITDKRGVL